MRDISSDDSDDDDNLSQYGACAASSSSSLQEGMIIGLTSLEVYFACPVPKCNGVKLQSREVAGSDTRLKLYCENHDGYVGADATSKNLVCRFLIDQAGKLTNASAFTPIVRELFDAKLAQMPPLLDRASLKHAILELFPYPLKFKLSSTSVIQSVLVKHDI